jgi:malate/lactate dehydrogenase
VEQHLQVSWDISLVCSGASVAFLVDSILNDQKKMIACSVFVEGEYGQNDICIGVPCIIGKNGIEEILDIALMMKKSLVCKKCRRG